MGRPRKIQEENEEEIYLKVKRVDGQKVTRMMDCPYFQEFPETYEKLMRYNVVELPKSVIKSIYGIKEVEINESEFNDMKEEE